MKYQVKCGSWLHSKQDTSKSIELLNQYMELNKSMDYDLRRGVVAYVKNNYTMLGRALYKARNIYEDNMSFEKFIGNFINHIGVEELKPLLSKSIDKIFKDNKELKNKYTREDVLKAIKVYMFYTTYIGYSFEQRIRDLITNNTKYDIKSSEYLDNKCAIDLLVINYDNGRVIGLQFKSKSFLSLDKDTRLKYYDKNRYGVLNKLCEDVYYIFHNELCDVVSNNFIMINNYQNVCKSSKEEFYPMVEDIDYFIKELAEIME